MALFSRNVLLLMVVFFMITRCQAIFRHHTQTIRSTNDVGAEMTVHCKSKDDDLGSHLISVKRFEWGSESHYFDIYISYRDHPPCNVCLWSIRPKGPCMWNYET
ncbi:hypothetical protein PRUPE_1G057100, partial [Prunus persica]